MADQTRASWLRSSLTSFKPATVMVWGCSGNLLAYVAVSDVRAEGEILILDAKICGTVLTIVFCDHQDVWVVSCNLLNTRQSLCKRELTGKVALRDIGCKKIQLELDDNKQIWVRKLD